MFPLSQFICVLFCDYFNRLFIGICICLSPCILRFKRILVYIFSWGCNITKSTEPNSPEAMMQSQQSKPNHSAMMMWIAAATKAPNESEVTGILRWAVRLRTGCLKKQLPMAIDVLRHLMRLGIHEAHVDKFKVMHDWIDSALTNFYGVTKVGFLKTARLHAETATAAHLDHASRLSRCSPQ